MIDWERVTDLRSEIGAEDFAEVVALFLDEADEVVSGLAAAETPKDLENALHFLKGSALNLGFAELARFCQDGERQAAAGECIIDIARVAAAYDTSKLVFEAGLDRFSAIRVA